MQQPGFGAPRRPWRTFGSGIVVLATAVGMYFYLGYLESSNTSARVPALISWLYDLGGKELVAGFIGIIGLGACGVGIAGFANKADETVALRNAPPIAATELTRTLMPALEFTPEDLAANQRGQISPAQQARLSKLSSSSTKWGLISGMLMLVLFGGIGAYVFYFAPGSAAMRTSITSDHQAATMLPIVAGLIGLIVFGSLALALLRARSAGKGALRAVEGPVDLDAITMNA